MRLKQCVLIASMALAWGCQSNTTPPPQGSVPPPLPVVKAPVGNTPDQAVDTDPSAQRLDDILGALLLYFRANQGMPPALEDLRTVAGFGSELNLISPSGQPYGYVPAGLTIPGNNKRLVVYDPAENPNGRRWCILVSALSPGAALTAEVLEIPEAMFREYLASNP
jgi:hypothetical protein